MVVMIAKYGWKCVMDIQIFIMFSFMYVYAFHIKKKERKENVYHIQPESHFSYHQ